jgi:hypothetical protein
MSTSQGARSFRPTLRSKLQNHLDLTHGQPSRSRNFFPRPKNDFAYASTSVRDG